MSQDRRAAGRDRVTDSAHVVVEPGLPFDLALKRFRRSVERAGIMRELKNRAAYRSPSGRRRLKSRRARKRAANAAAKGAGAFTPKSEFNEKPQADEDL